MVPNQFDGDLTIKNIRLIDMKRRISVDLENAL